MVTTATVESEVTNRQEESMEVINSSADNPLLRNLEQAAKSEGLQFIEELIFENGAVYKGKSNLQI